MKNKKRFVVLPSSDLDCIMKTSEYNYTDTKVKEEDRVTVIRSCVIGVELFVMLTGSEYKKVFIHWDDILSIHNSGFEFLANNPDVKIDRKDEYEDDDLPF